jgi:hypothetical protein
MSHYAIRVGAHLTEYEWFMYAIYGKNVISSYMVAGRESHAVMCAEYSGYWEKLDLFDKTFEFVTLER